jgi:transcriptional regulator with XRE-family HTH domain
MKRFDRQKLIAIREAAGLSQIDLVKKMQALEPEAPCHRVTYCHYESGKYNPGANRLMVLAVALGIGTDHLEDFFS